MITVMASSQLSLSRFVSCPLLPLDFQVPGRSFYFVLGSLTESNSVPVFSIGSPSGMPMSDSDFIQTHFGLVRGVRQWPVGGGTRPSLFWWLWLVCFYPIYSDSIADSLPVQN
jgi:hypothetical protein